MALPLLSRMVSPISSIMAIDIPAKAIIGPIDKSNSPAIINKAAPTAIIPNWAIIAMLFFKPKALKAFPSDAKPRANIIMIMTMKEPISGLRHHALYPAFILKTVRFITFRHFNL